MNDDETDSVMSDDDVLTMLKQSRDNVVRNIRLITLTPKPSYEIDGQKFEHSDYLKQLMATLSALNEQIRAYDGPFEFYSQAY